MPRPTALHDIIVATIRHNGPLTLARFMDLALYHPEHGYYSTAAQRSGRAGDFFTSVDVGPLFGEMLAVQFDEMHCLLRQATGRDEQAFDVVEAGAGNGRLARDVLDAAARFHPKLYDAARMVLVESSAAARAQQAGHLGAHASKLAASTAVLPHTVHGVIYANELLDAMPAHAVAMHRGVLREIYIDERQGRLVEVEGNLSRPELAEHFERVGVQLADGARAEVSLAALEWVRAAAAALAHGFLLIIDYGHRAAQLYSPLHASGTLLAYRRHTAGSADWLAVPGAVDLTTHVDLTALVQAAESSGLTTLGLVDQTYLLAGLGITERLGADEGRAAVARRLGAKTLVMPGGLGSTMKVAIFSRGIGAPRLKGLAGGRLT